MSTNAVSSKETYSSGKFVAGLFTFLKYAVLVFACLIVFIPLIVVFLGSLKSNTEFLSSNVFALPTKVEWNNYKTAFIDGKVLLGLKNTAIIIMISCTGTIITGTMTAYVLQRAAACIQHPRCAASRTSGMQAHLRWKRAKCEEGS